MRVLISAEGQHDPPGQYMVVDGHGLLIDLTGVAGTLVDPTILRVEWGPSVITGQPQEAGIITRRGEARQQPFYDKALLTPYINAFRARLAVLTAVSHETAGAN